MNINIPALRIYNHLLLTNREFFFLLGFIFTMVKKIKKKKNESPIQWKRYA